MSKKQNTDTNSLYEKVLCKLREYSEAEFMSAGSRNALRDVRAILEMLEHLPALQAYDIIDQARLMATIRVHSDTYRKAAYDFDSTNASLDYISRTKKSLYYSQIMLGCCNETT